MLLLRKGLLLMALNACHAQNGATSGKDGGRGDTLRLAAAKTSVYVLDSQHPLLQIPVSISKKAGTGHYYLRLSGVTLPAAPDGIYELHLTPQLPQSSAKLTGRGTGFVDVLNTYALTGSEETGTHVDIDITAAMRQASASLIAGNKLYLSILFSGNKEASGRESGNAGKLRLTDIGIYEVN